MSAAFYKEMLGCNETQADRISKFMMLCGEHKDAVLNPRPWANYGKARVYFEFWSQNNLPPLKTWHATYYDADEDDCVVVRSSDMIYVRKPLIGHAYLEKWCGHNFSGTKTRARVQSFLRCFYERYKETNRD